MPRYEFEQFAAVRNYAGISFSPDGNWLTYVSNASGQFNVWKQPVHPDDDGLPLMPIQLTALVENATRTAAWSPTGQQIVTMADRHGTENFQIYQIPAVDGWLYPLTAEPEVRHELSPRPFSPDGRYIAYSSNERDPEDMDLIVRDLETGETRTVLAGDANYFPGYWSPDGRYLVGVKYNMNTDQELYLVELATGQSRHLTPHDGLVQYRPGAWHPDGSGFYLVTDREREFLGLAFCNVQSADVEWVETPEWDVIEGDISTDARYLAWTVPPFWRRFMKEWVGEPEEDYGLLIERSPITYVDEVQAPLLVIQGANDPRVVKGESDQMVARLEELGREVEYMVFEDEGHGFTKTSNLLKALRASAKWFEQYLLEDKQ